MEQVEIEPWGRLLWNDRDAWFENTSPISIERREEIESGLLVALQYFVGGGFMLHASCISYEGRAIALVGRSRAGKSTLAAIMAQQGCSLVSDGVTLFEPSTLGLRNGRRLCKLSDESIAQLGLSADEFPYVTEDRIKRYVTAPGPPPPDGLNLSEAFVIADGDTDEIQSLTPTEQVLALISNGIYTSRLPPKSARLQWERAVQAVQNGLLVHRLVRRKKWENIPSLVSILFERLR